MKRVVIWWHKRQARIARIAMLNIADHYSCGITLVEAYSASYNISKNTYEYHLDKLRKIDPDFGKKI